MERNVQKNGLVNLLAAGDRIYRGLLVAVYVGSLAGRLAAVFLGLHAGGLHQLVSDAARGKRAAGKAWKRTNWPGPGGLALFEARDSKCFPPGGRASSSRFFGAGILRAAVPVEAGGAWLFWTVTGKTTEVIVADRALPPWPCSRVFALVLFILEPLFGNHCPAGK